MPPYEPMMEGKTKTPWHQKISRDQLLYIFVAVYLVGGAFYLHFHNGFAYLTAVYALVEIVTTIGYGDFDFTGYFDEATGSEKSSDFGKIFMAFYVMVGLTAVAGAISKLAEKATLKAEEAFRAKMRAAQMKSSGMTEEQVKSKYGESNKLKAACGAFIFMVAFGTIFYGTYEDCTCSYGRSAAAGCVEITYQQCVDTGGYQKSYIDAFYMSCITLTTVGFGDFAPKTYVGRGVGIIWMLLGVVTTANFIGEISSEFIEAEKTRKNYGKIGYETFAQIDVDGNGTLSKYEFVSFVLLQYGLVKKEDLDEIIAMYDKLDTSGDGVVDYEDIAAFAESM